MWLNTIAEHCSQTKQVLTLSLAVLQAASTYVMGTHANEEDKEKVDALMSSVGEEAPTR